MGKYDELRNSVDTLCDIFKSVASLLGRKTDISQVIRYEFVQYSVYLLTVDGVISQTEVDAITEITRIPLPRYTLLEKLGAGIFFSNDFGHTVPDILDLAVSTDKMMTNLGLAQFSCISEKLVDIYRYMGSTICLLSGTLNDRQIDRYNEYIDMLKNHIYNSQNDNTVPTNPILSTIIEDNGNKALEQLINELNNLIGLKNVKEEVNSLIHLQEIKKLRKERGLKDIPISNHLVFYGNPGTGKTTVARLLAQIYHKMGILSKGHLIEVDRAGLVAGYVGQTAIKTQDKINEALGGVLFIDEAYSLTSSSYKEDDFGMEAINTLIKAMEDHRDDFIVIVSGYPNLMSDFINSNPGLQSRFNKYISFDDYTIDELVEIFKKMCIDSGYIPTEDAILYFRKVFTEKYNNRTSNFGNAREVRNYFERAITNQANRIFGDTSLSNEQLCSLTVADLTN